MAAGSWRQVESVSPHFSHSPQDRCWLVCLSVCFSVLKTSFSISTFPEIYLNLLVSGTCSRNSLIFPLVYMPFTVIKKFLFKKVSFIELGKRKFMVNSDKFLSKPLLIIRELNYHILQIIEKDY